MRLLDRSRPPTTIDEQGNLPDLPIGRFQKAKSLGGNRVSLGIRCHMSISQVTATVLKAAIDCLRKDGVRVFTFALYFDHESHAISVCADTKENSTRVVREINAYNGNHFHRLVATGDLSSAALWQANIGRNLSLGDFSRKNLARTSVSGVQKGDAFYLQLVRAVVAVEAQVLELTTEPESVVFVCSGEHDEVAYVWSAVRADA